MCLSTGLVGVESAADTLSEPPSNGPELSLKETLLRIEQRLTRLEHHLKLQPLEEGSPTSEVPTHTDEDVALQSAHGETSEDELEFVVGQNWFAGVGILVLSFGVCFALSLPLSELPSVVPSLTGYTLTLGLFLVARFWQKSFKLVASCLRGAGMSLLFFSTLRLFFFGTTHVLEVDSMEGCLILGAVVGINFGMAFRQKIPWLCGLALVTGLVATVAIGIPFVIFGGIAILAGVTAIAAVRYNWPAMLLFAIPASYTAHLLWVINRPWSGRSFQIQSEPAVGIFCLLVYAVIFAIGSLRRRERTHESSVTIAAALLNCGLGYGVFLLQSPAIAGALLAPAHLVAAVVFMGLAVSFWQSEASRISTCFYAITGYMALSVAIVKLFPVPQVFIWLSGQSLLVVATALWFRSRLIVVANFFIYVSIVLTYVLVTKHETGICIGFGVVALLTARILNWQKARLQLKTELMRNAYLAGAFVIFPYSLYHLVPRAFVSLSWVAVAIAYYLMNFIVRSPKYRWMGHLTLLFTVAYVLVVGVTQLAPAYRIISFLVLGSVLMVVSLIFARVRTRRKRASVEHQSEPFSAP